MNKAELTALKVENIQKAIFTNDITAVENLIANKVNLNVLIKVAGDCYYRSPLNFAMHHNDMSMFKLLIQSGININMHNGWGTDLMNAISSNKIEHIKLLLECGARLYIKDRYGQTAITKARQVGCKDIIELLDDEIIRRKGIKMEQIAFV